MTMTAIIKGKHLRKFVVNLLKRNVCLLMNLSAAFLSANQVNICLTEH